MTSKFLLKGHNILNFLFAFFPKISETLEAHISGSETDIKGKKLSSWFYKSLILANKEIIKNFDV